jgi:hypothetical protein
MIARFDAIEQLAAGSLAARRISAADQPGNRSAAASDTPGSRAGRLGSSGPPDPRQPAGSGRSGSGGPGAGAHRHYHRRR